MKYFVCKQQTQWISNISVSISSSKQQQQQQQQKNIDQLLRVNTDSYLWQKEWKKIHVFMTAGQCQLLLPIADGNK